MAESKIEYCKCCKLPKSKTCNNCGKEKTTDNFYPGKKVCKECKSQYNKKRYLVLRAENSSEGSAIEIS